MERSDDVLVGGQTSLTISNNNLIINGELIGTSNSSNNGSSNMSSSSNNNDQNQQQQQQQSQRSNINYTMPGILHFLQHEWNRFEFERQQWEVERAELTAKIAFLQGERRGQDNLKINLIRRIKMLELALKQERIKYHKLKCGAEPATTNMAGIATNPLGAKITSSAADENKTGIIL
jgi:hypothetical protein